MKMSKRSLMLLVLVMIIGALIMAAGAVAFAEAVPEKKPTATPAPGATSTPVPIATPLPSVMINATVFPDAAFRNYVATKLDKNSDGILNEKEVRQVKSMDLSGIKTIKDLTGIYVFVDLQVLNVSNNKLTKLDVSQNRMLKNLTADENQLTGLDLSKNTRMQNLTCNNNVRTVKVKAGKLDVTELGITGSKMSDVKGAVKDGDIIVMEKPGTFTYTYDCGNGFKAAFAIKMTASPKVAITSVTLAKTSYPYKGVAVKPGLTVKAKVDGTTVTLKSSQYKVTCKDNIKVGTATVTVTGTGFFKGTISKTFKITKVAITSVKVVNPSLPWTGRAHKPILTVKAKVNGKTVTLSKSTDYTATYTDNIEPGTATVTVKGKGNFKGTIKATFKINKLKMSTATVTLAKTTIAYTGSALKPKVTVKAKVDGKLVTLVKGVDYTVTYTDNVDPGTATVTVKGKGHFTGTRKVTFTITE